MNIITDKKYNIIYADPPWRYGGSGGTKWLPAESYYPTMSFDDLNDMSTNINNIAADDCLLFMWVVSPELPNCIKVGERWGFKYITVAFIWNKQRANVGNYTMSNCELCLLFKRGNIPNDRVRNPGQQQLLCTLEENQYFSEPITIHSRKPNEFRLRIERMFPKSDKIELFARQLNNNWDSWGYDIDKSGLVKSGNKISKYNNISKDIFNIGRK